MKKKNQLLAISSIILATILIGAGVLLQQFVVKQPSKPFISQFGYQISPPSGWNKIIETTPSQPITDLTLEDYKNKPKEIIDFSNSDWSVRLTSTAYRLPTSGQVASVLESEQFAKFVAVSIFDKPAAVYNYKEPKQVDQPSFIFKPFTMDKTDPQIQNLDLSKTYQGGSPYIWWENVDEKYYVSFSLEINPKNGVVIDNESINELSNFLSSFSLIESNQLN